MSEPRDPIPRYREHAGAAILTQGFRPFFLLAALWAALALGIWILSLEGWLGVPSVLDPVSWHIHEMLYGFIAAAVAGFLLTAIPNWTGRLPLQGYPLLLLVAVWLAGRIVMAVPLPGGAVTAAAIDGAFLLLLWLVVIREILAGRNWRNLPMVAALLLLLIGNVVFHLEAVGTVALDGLGWRFGIAVMVMLVGLIGGRIVPSFTRNWLVKERPDAPLPAPFGGFDRIVLLVTLAALIVWLIAREIPAAALLGIAAGLQLIRLGRWRGWRTGTEPLLLILHVAYAWIPIGLGLLAVAAGHPAVTETGALHALTAGAMGTMILAVMIRATLGHTGRALAAGAGTTAIFGLVTLGAIARVLAAFWPEATRELLIAGGLTWIAAFLGFCVIYGPMLLKPRVAGTGTD
ncbi:MAG: NnrS family protein [Rhodospirillales bacterium]